MMSIPLLYFTFSFLAIKSVTEKNIIFFKENAEFIFAIGFQAVFCGSNFCDLGPESHK